MSELEGRGQFSIGEVLAQLRPEFPDISTSKIRFLEAKGLIEPARSRSGYRRFSAEDIERLRYILTVQRDSYLPLQVIRERLADGAARILRGYRGLNRDSALHGIDRAGEVGDDAVAGGVEYPAPVRRNQLIDGDAARLQPGKRAGLVPRHQPAVAGNVSGEDRGEFALYRMDRHAWLLPGAVYIDRRDWSASFQALSVSRKGRSNLMVRF